MNMIRKYDSIHFRRIGQSIHFHLFGSENYHISIPYKLLDSGCNWERQIIQMSELQVWTLFFSKATNLVRKSDDWTCLKFYIHKCIIEGRIPTEDGLQEELKDMRSQRGEYIEKAEEQVGKARKHSYLSDGNNINIFI